MTAGEADQCTGVGSARGVLTFGADAPGMRATGVEHTPSWHRWVRLCGHPPGARRLFMLSFTSPYESTYDENSGVRPRSGEVGLELGQPSHTRCAGRLLREPLQARSIV